MEVWLSAACAASASSVLTQYAKPGLSLQRFLFAYPVLVVQTGLLQAVQRNQRTATRNQQPQRRNQQPQRVKLNLMSPRSDPNDCLGHQASYQTKEQPSSWQWHDVIIASVALQKGVGVVADAAVCVRKRRSNQQEEDDAHEANKSLCVRTWTVSPPHSSSLPPRPSWAPSSCGPHTRVVPFGRSVCGSFIDVE